MYFKKLNKDLISPYQHYQWELNKKVSINNFDTSNDKCSTRLYYLKLDQLLFCPNHPIFEVKIGGQIKEFKDKCGSSEMTVLREVTKEEILHLIEKNDLDNKLGYKYSEALYPINPTLIDPPMITEKEIQLLESWRPVSELVWDSVWDSVSDSVWDSVWGYISSLFPRIKQWKYFEHKKGVNPFQPCIDLWKIGLIPSFDGKTWRLHGGKNADILYVHN